MSETKKKLGLRIKLLRKERSFTQEKLAEKCGIETGTLSAIESGRNFPSLHVLEKIANVLNFELADFFKFKPCAPETPNLDKEINKLIKRHNPKTKKIIYTLVNALSDCPL